MRLFTRVIDNSEPEPDRLPLFAFRGVVDGRRQNYLLRYECPCGCGGLSRKSEDAAHRSGDESRQRGRR